MRVLGVLAVLLCAGALASCSSPSEDITSAANDLTRLLGKAAHGPLSARDARQLRQDLQTLVADQAGENALVATGALKTGGQQAGGDLRSAARASGPHRAEPARTTMCTETFGVALAAPGGPARASAPWMQALLA